MGAIVIRADNRSNKILKELAERLGANVTFMNEEHYIEFLPGNLMDTERQVKSHQGLPSSGISIPKDC